MFEKIYKFELGISFMINYSKDAKDCVDMAREMEPKIRRDYLFAAESFERLANL